MKNILKKNQIIITALIIMIAVAGYLSLTSKDAANLVDTNGNNVQNIASSAAPAGEAKETSGEDVTTTDISAEDNGEDTVKVEDNQELKATTNPKATVAPKATQKTADSKTTDSKTAQKDGSAGDAVLVNNTIGADYFDNAKLSREQTRSKNKEVLMQLINNANTTAAQKEKAMNEIISMATVTEKENVTETLLEGKGFTDAVVNIENNEADVIVNANNLTEQQIAQIQDIVQRKTDIAMEHIVITPVGVAQK